MCVQAESDFLFLPYKNNKIFTDDMHKSTCGKQNESSTYSFEVDNYETGAEYTIKANIRGVGGVDNNGVIFIKYNK